MTIQEQRDENQADSMWLLKSSPQRTRRSQRKDGFLTNTPVAVSCQPSYRQVRLPDRFVAGNKSELRGVECTSEEQRTLEARCLTKNYDYITAVRQVSFCIRPGEILGYLGPNGAGKSTTVKMLTGLIEPSDGQILYKGRSIYDDLAGFQRVIGYVPEEAHLYPHLSGREYLQLVGRLRGIPRRILEPKMDELLRLFSLWEDRFTSLSSYSKGMRQKILLSAALMHNPEVLILDEPFSGLDVTSALMLRRLLSGLARQGKIILYSSHVLEVVEKVCSQVLILRHGEVVAYDSITRLRELMQQPSLEGVFAQLAQVDDGAELADRILETVGSTSELP
jgi:ABC-2 type transport system ATP-binding protein